jgi:hypothetical protein
MKKPSPSAKGTRLGDLGIPSGDANLTPDHPAKSTANNVVAFPGARPERSNDAREAWQAMVAAITSRDSYILEGGAISDAEYRRRASIAVVARAAFERSFLGGAA